jgi:hypothetical protein
MIKNGISKFQWRITSGRAHETPVSPPPLSTVSEPQLWNVTTSLNEATSCISSSCGHMTQASGQPIGFLLPVLRASPLNLSPHPNLPHFPNILTGFPISSLRPWNHTSYANFIRIHVPPLPSTPFCVALHNTVRCTIVVASLGETKGSVGSHLIMRSHSF